MSCHLSGFSGCAEQPDFFSRRLLDGLHGRQHHVRQPPAVGIGRGRGFSAGKAQVCKYVHFRNPLAYGGSGIGDDDFRTAIRKLKDGEGNYLLNKDATAKWGYSLFGHDVYVSQSMPDMAAGKRAVLYLDPTGLAVKVAENPSVQVLREKFADEHAVGVICWMEVDSKVENKQKIAVLDMKATVTPGG